MRILFLSDNFPPETNAPATRTFEHARRWVSAGAAVTVVTTAPNFPTGRLFPGYRNRLFQRERLDGIEVVRVWTYIAPNEGVVRRTLDYLSFMLAGILAGLVLPRPDVIVGTSPQFFTACGAYLLSRLVRRPWVFELRDLWPDSIVAVGAMRESAAIRALRRLEYVLYRRADRIVSVTQAFRDVLTKNGIPPEKIAVVPNGVDLGTLRPGPKPADLVARHGLEGQFVAAYVGTVGMAHGLETLLGAAESLRDRCDIAFVVVGEGAERRTLEDQAARRGLHNVRFIGSVPKAEVVRYWWLADVALVLLRDREVFRHVLPSKMFEAMACGRPVVLGVRGEAAALLARAQAGVVIPPEDARALAAAVARLADSPAERAQWGENGRAFVEREHDRDRLAAAMLHVLTAVARGQR